MSRQNRFITSDLSDEQIEEMMDSVEDESEADYNSDDSVVDPDYVPDEIESEIRSELNKAIENMHQGDTSHAFIDDINFTSINIEDSLVLPSASSSRIVELDDIEALPIVFSDSQFLYNFYTSLPLLVYLRSRGIYALGTVRANRIPNGKLPQDKELKNEPRGYASEYVSNVQGVPVSVVVWKDNKTVRLASTYVGILPFIKTNDESQIGKIARYDKQNKGYVEIDCPTVIAQL